MAQFGLKETVSEQQDVTLIFCIFVLISFCGGWREREIRGM